MRVKLILPALKEAGSAQWRPIKCALFPPLGLATLAANLDPAETVDLKDQHVEALDLNDTPDLVLIQVYIINTRRAHQIADHYRAKGCIACLGGLHVSSLPDEAVLHRFVRARAAEAGLRSVFIGFESLGQTRRGLAWALAARRSLRVLPWDARQQEAR